MDPIISWILVILGVAGIIVYAKTKVSVGHPAVVPIVAVSLVIAPFAMGWIALPNQTPEQATVIDDTTCAEFDVTASAISLNSNSNYNDATRTFNIPVQLNSTTNALDYTTAGLNFSFEPLPEAGSTTTDLAVIYYESDYLMSFEGSDILSKTDNIYNADWTDDGGTSDYSGADTMEMTGSGWANITWTFNSGNDTWAEDVDSGDVYDTIASWNVRLSNGCAWSDVYTVNLIVTSVTA